MPRLPHRTELRNGDYWRYCPKCEQWYMLTPEFWQRNRSDVQYGFNWWCKECANAAKRLRRAIKQQPKSEERLCDVTVIENDQHQRRALRYDEWIAGIPNPPAGWRVIGKGSHLLDLSNTDCTLEML